MSRNFTPSDEIADIDKEIFYLHNELRENPKYLIKDLELMLNQFDGILLKREGKVTLKTKEGVDAVREAISFCSQQMPVSSIGWVDSIAFASKEHVKDIGPKGLLQHDSSDGRSDVNMRLQKYGNKVSSYGENLSFACLDAKEVLI